MHSLFLSRISSLALHVVGGTFTFRGHDIQPPTDDMPAMRHRVDRSLLLELRGAAR
jgi:hypothetical protein